jgi:hypothetical protein
MSVSRNRIRILLAILTPAPLAVTALFAAAPAGAAAQTRRLPVRIAHSTMQEAVLPGDPRQLVNANNEGDRHEL